MTAKIMRVVPMKRLAAAAIFLLTIGPATLSAQEFNYWSVVYQEGSTEGGSSGAALLNERGEIIGQLTGGNASCQSINDPDYYDIFGKFQVSWGLGLSESLGAASKAESKKSVSSKASPAGATRLPAPSSPGLRMKAQAVPEYTVTIPEDRIERARAEFERRVGEQKFTKRKLMGTHIDLSPIPAEKWERLEDGQGEGSWRVVIRAGGARFVRLHFVRMDADAEVIVYGDPRGAGKRVQRTRTAVSRDFWGPITQGELVFLEVLGASSTRPTLVVDKISYGQKELFGKPRPGPKSGKEAGCYLDINCSDEWEEFKTAVGQMAYEMDEGTMVCTGTLIMDAAESFQPWFYTARHCFDTEAVADSLIVTFFFHTDSCNGVAPDWDQVDTYTEGSQITMQSGATDVLLLLLDLDTPLPAGITYLGWDLDDPSWDDPITVIHHPDGSYMRISFGTLSGESADVTADDDSQDDDGNDDAAAGDDDDDECCGC